MTSWRAAKKPVHAPFSSAGLVIVEVFVMKTNRNHMYTLKGEVMLPCV